MSTDHQGTVYDIAIIGGGIAGAGIARDAALRGLRAVLFEKNSFGSGTSSKSSKLIHGGIRYLELSWNALIKGNLSEAWKNFRFVFLSLKECRVLSKIAPELVKPLPMLVPIYKNSPRKRLSVFIGAYLYFLLSALSGGGKCPKILRNKDSVLKEMPELQPEGLLGGVILWDHYTNDIELVRSTIASAVRNGAECFEKAEITSYEYNSSEEIYVVSVKTANGDKKFRAKKLVNAAGPWIDKVRGADGRKEPYLVPVAGSHIELPAFLKLSAILQAKDGRIFFVINIDGRSRVGTTERKCEDPDRVTAPESDANYLLDSLSRYFPGQPFKKENILSSDAGVRPLSSSSRASNENSISRDHEIRIDAQGVLHIVGVKLTDHRRAAEHAVDRLATDLGHQKKSATASTPLIR